MTTEAMPELGTILEIYRVSKVDVIGSIVELYEVEESGSYLVKTVDTAPVRRFRVPPRACRVPRILCDINEETCPAPTWEELPPERGTILELHSTGSEEYDGILAEFYKIDQRTGQYFVKPLESTFQAGVVGMRIKPKCCRRPNIKSLELREFLNRLVVYYRDGGCESVEDPNNRLERLLRKDPCCVPAHLLLSGSVPDTQDVLEKKCQHMRRGIANLYAYEGILPNDLVVRCKRHYSTLLYQLRHYRSATRNQQGVLLLADGKQPWDQAKDELVMAKIYLVIDRDSDKDHYPSKAINTLSKAADELIKAITFLSNIERGSEYQDNHDDFSRCTREVHSIVSLLFGEFASTQTTLDEQDRSSQMFPLWKAAMDIASRILEACTSSDGTIQILNEDTKFKLERTIDECNECMRNVEPASTEGNETACD